MSLFVQFWIENPCVGSSILSRATINNVKKPFCGFFIYVYFHVTKSCVGKWTISNKYHKYCVSVVYENNMARIYYNVYK